MIGIPRNRVRRLLAITFVLGAIAALCRAEPRWCSVLGNSSNKLLEYPEFARRARDSVFSPPTVMRLKTEAESSPVEMIVTYRDPVLKLSFVDRCRMIRRRFGRILGIGKTRNDSDGDFPGSEKRLILGFQ